MLPVPLRLSAAVVNTLFPPAAMVALPALLIVNAFRLCVAPAMKFALAATITPLLAAMEPLDCSMPALTLVAPM